MSTNLEQALETQNLDSVNPIMGLENVSYGALSVSGVEGFDPMGTLMFPRFAAQGHKIETNYEARRDRYMTQEITQPWDRLVSWIRRLPDEKKALVNDIIMKKGNNAYVMLLEKALGCNAEDAKKLMDKTALSILTFRWDDYKKLKLLPNLAVTEGLTGETLEDAETLSARVGYSLNVFKLLTEGNKPGLYTYKRFIAPDLSLENIAEENPAYQPIESGLNARRENANPSTATAEEYEDGEDVDVKYIPDANSPNSREGEESGEQIAGSDRVSDNVINNEPIDNIIRTPTRTTAQRTPPTELPYLHALMPNTVTTPDLNELRLEKIQKRIEEESRHKKKVNVDYDPEEES